jgi:hypothetical protein
MGRTSGLVGFAVVAALGVLGTTVPAQAADPVVAFASDSGAVTNIGTDVSYPQCDKSGYAIPADVPFAIVGANGGVTNKVNECFVDEYTAANNITQVSATPTEQERTAVYINTGNPALAAKWWPSSDNTQPGNTGSSPVIYPAIPVTNPRGVCSHLAGQACAYVYGYSMAYNDYQRVSNALPAAPTMWWLDVESPGTTIWQKDLVANASSLIGMVDYLHTQGVTVGLYSTAYQWKLIAGTTSSTSTLAHLQSWLAGSSATGAAAACEGSPLTPYGRVSMVQYVSGGVDRDYSCHLFASASATVSPAAPSVVGTKLTAIRGTWASGSVTYSYQWLRNGVAISGATTNVHTTTSSDVGKTISVKVTGKKSGYSTTPLTSAGVTVLGRLGAKPAGLTGTAQVGHTLTATRGTWTPSGVTYTFAWYRDGVAFTPDTATTYKLTAVDVGHYITVKVTGTKTGYAPVTESAKSAIVKA